MDQWAEKLIEKFHVRPAFKGYKGYRHCLCTSINEEVVHGIPSPKRKLQEGDIIGLDFGVIYEGYYGDSAITVPVGEVSVNKQRLIDVTRNSLLRGIEKIKKNGSLSDVSSCIQAYVEKMGYSVVREFVGHGIGQSLHEDPPVPNYGEPGMGPTLEIGMVLAIEPMVNEGSPEVKILKDGWTAVTVDGSTSAHFEHTVAITEEGPKVFTSL